MDIKEINYEKLKEIIDNKIINKLKSTPVEILISETIINFLRDAGCIEKIKQPNSNLTWLSKQDFEKVEEVYKTFNCLYQPDGKTYVHAIGIEERF